jgi:hypothetical protein
VTRAAKLKLGPLRYFINVDGLPSHWADASNTGTIDIKDLPPGQHKVTIDLVFSGQSITITFTMPQTSETP